MSHATSGQHTHEYMRKPSVDVIKVGPGMIFSRNMDVIMLGVGPRVGGGNNLT